MSAETKVGRVRLHLHESGYKLGSHTQYHAEVSKRNKNVVAVGAAVTLAAASVKAGSQRVLLISSTVGACSVMATASQLIGIDSARLAANIPDRSRFEILADPSVRCISVSAQLLLTCVARMCAGVDTVIFADLLTPRTMAQIMDTISAIASAEKRVIDIRLVKDEGNFADAAFKTLHRAAKTILPGLTYLRDLTLDTGADIVVPDPIRLAVVDAIARVGASGFVTGNGRIAGAEMALTSASATRTAQKLEHIRARESALDAATRLAPLWLRDLAVAPACSDHVLGQSITGDSTGVTITITIKPKDDAA